MPSRLTPRRSADDRQIQAIPTAPTVPAVLRWPSVSNDGMSVDAERFPEREYIHMRRSMYERSAIITLPAFANAVAIAYHRLLIMDPHFDEASGVRSLRYAFACSQASDVRLLTGSVCERELERNRSELEQRINSRRSDNQRVAVRWSTELPKNRYPFLHDRFAVVDSALWHFGATVGGGHPGLNAVSGPWSAEETRAVEFFEECWRELGTSERQRKS